MRNALVLGRPRTGSSRIAHLLDGHQGCFGTSEPLNVKQLGSFNERLSYVLDPNSLDLDVTKILTNQLSSCPVKDTLQDVGSLYARHILTVRRNTLDHYLSFLLAHSTDVYNAKSHSPTPVTIGRDSACVYERDNRRCDEVEAIFVGLFNPEIIVFEDHQCLSPEDTVRKYNLHDHPPDSEIYERIYPAGLKLHLILNLVEVLSWYPQLHEWEV